MTRRTARDRPACCSPSRRCASRSCPRRRPGESALAQATARGKSSARLHGDLDRQLRAVPGRLAARHHGPRLSRRVASGTCFVETRSGDVSLYGSAGAARPPRRASSSPAPRGTSATASASCRSTGARGSSSASPTRPASRLELGSEGDRVWVNRGCARPSRSCGAAAVAAGQPGPAAARRGAVPQRGEAAVHQRQPDRAGRARARTGSRPWTARCVARRCGPTAASTRVRIAPNSRCGAVAAQRGSGSASWPSAPVSARRSAAACASSTGMRPGRCRAATRCSCGCARATRTCGPASARTATATDTSTCATDPSAARIGRYAAQTTLSRLVAAV